ncbi:MAG: hypothetical protein IJS72_00535, partial [Oscillospiraceae bacterium]|nr:hypothetical protein [Oscillospiraceae bacterium]
MKKITARWIALMLALVMCVGVMPVSAIAEGEEEPAAVNEPAEPAGQNDGGEVEGDGSGETETPARGGTDGFDDNRVVTDEGLRIERLYASIHRGAEQNEHDDWVWTPVNDMYGHEFTYKFT